MAPSDEITPSPARPAEGISLVPPPGERPALPEAAAGALTRSPEPASTERSGAVLVLLVSVLALLLGSFPARNSDLWLHLAAGRRLTHGGPAGAHWLFDLLAYVTYAAVGGAGLVLAKALLVVGIALVLLRLCRVGREWWPAAFCTALALVAMGTRLLLQPATVSYLFLALTLWTVRERRRAPVNGLLGLLPPWPLFVLFVAWVNVDGWFVLGLGVVALVWLGQALDEGQEPLAGGPSPGLGRFSFVVSLAVLAAGCLLNPAHVAAFALPPELASLGPASGQVASPFERAYFAHVGLSPAGLAYFPLLGLSLLSFLLDLPGWSWRRFLPWLALVLLSAAQVRAVPFFAVVAGPVLAWNLHSWLARRAGAADRSAGALHGLMVVLALALVVCAWPGWLQGSPFEPRRWAVEAAPSLERGALAVRHWHEEGKLAPEARGLHLSAESANAFAWFCPQEPAVRDDALAAAIRDQSGAAADVAARMRSAGVDHVIVYGAELGRGGQMSVLETLLADPARWPVLHQEGDLIVFGWRDPAAKADPFRDWQTNWNALAARPAEDKRAPRQAPDREPEVRPWWEAFWKPTPPRSLDRDEAALHLVHAEALARSAPFRHRAAWEPAEAAAFVGAACGWAGPAGLLDAHRRLTLVRPQSPADPSAMRLLPPTDQLAHSLQQRFALHRDDVPPALLYLTVRAARRAIAANPDDAQAYRILGDAYQTLLHSTRERVWADQLPEVRQLRRIQASAALNQAVALRPDLADAHLSLSQLYGDMDCVDLMLEHLRAYQKCAAKAGPPRGLTAEQFKEQQARYETDIAQLAKEVQSRQDRFALLTAGRKVGEQAVLAFQGGLGGKARDLLLESDIAAFGDKGMALELELLLRTGRPRTVLEWTDPEQAAALGSQSYHWTRAQARAAVGDYALAQEECAHLSGALGPLARGTDPPRKIMALLVAQRVLAEQPRGGFFAGYFLRTDERREFRGRVSGLAQALRREADVLVLRGLLALEEGDTEQAEADFRVALTSWKDAAAAASGAGLDFNGRALAEGCLEWLE